MTHSHQQFSSGTLAAQSPHSAHAYAGTSSSSISVTAEPQILFRHHQDETGDRVQHPAHTTSPHQHKQTSQYSLNKLNCGAANNSTATGTTLQHSAFGVGNTAAAVTSSIAGPSAGTKTATILVSKTKTKTGLPLLLKNSIN